MIEFILSILLLASVIVGWVKYRKEVDRRQRVEDRFNFMLRRAEDTYTWCNAELPEIGDAALFIAAFYSKQPHIEDAIGSAQNGSVDQFRGYMRRKYVRG